MTPEIKFSDQVQQISIAEYVDQFAGTPLIDVRSPGEFKKGHIPGAVNIPLFTDEERAKVGTAYKQISREKAIEIGYSYVEPKLQSFIAETAKIAPGGKVTIHCWRGGMRSRAFASHLAENGFRGVNMVEGGYKAFRNHVLNMMGRAHHLNIIGGFTGSGKTGILRELENIGEQTVDLEQLAHHKGSAFGAIGETGQPSVEQFENDLFWSWKDLDSSKPVWLEDESHNIGAVKIPMVLYTQMRNTTVFFLDIPKEERAKNLVKIYGKYEKKLLERSIEKISRKLGDQNAKLAIQYLYNDQLFETAMITLNYYDKSYLRGLERRDPASIVKISSDTTDSFQNARLLLEYAKTAQHGY